MADDKKKWLRDPFHNDVDYWKKLSPKEREWLRRYQSESRGVPKKGKPQLRKTDRLRKQMNDAANHARKDVFTKGKRTGLESVPLNALGATDPTSELVDALDEKRLLERFYEDDGEE